MYMYAYKYICYVYNARLPRILLLEECFVEDVTIIEFAQPCAIVVLS